MYAQISNTGTVLMVEDCYREGKQYPLKELYHKDILPLFTEVPEGIYPHVGWKYDAVQNTFTEPQILEYVPELNIYYNPYPQDKMLAILNEENLTLKAKLDESIIDTDFRILMLESLSASNR